MRYLLLLIPIGFLLGCNDKQIKKIEDKSIIIINVPEATHQQKPIYLNNVLTNKCGCNG